MTLVLAPVFGTVSLFHYDEGAQVAEGDVIGEIEAMKVMYQVVSPAAGILHWRRELGEVIGEGDDVAEVTP